MINKAIQFSVNNRMVVLIFTVLFVIAGWLGFKSLAIDALPDITNIQVSVNTMVDGFAPEETERYITIPIEAAMNGFSNVTHVRSLTKFGLSQVVVNFEDGTDIYKARQQVAERLQSVQGDLPQGVSPHLGPITTGLGEIFFYTVEADKIETGEARITQLMELRALQQWVIKPRLMTVKGVASVDTTGGYEKQVHIQPDIEKMSRYGIGFDDIAHALETTNRNVGGGYIQQGQIQLIVQSLGLFKSPDDIRRVPVKTLETFKTITIGDIAQVNLGSELRVGAALVDGKEAVLGMVYLLSGDNSRKVAVDVAQKTLEIAKNLPAGIKITPLYNRSELVDTTVTTVMHNLLVGAALVVIILVLLVGNVRAALITAAIIPLSLFFTFLMMNWRGISGNLMSLGALDFGIIVDAGVIVLENCVRRLSERNRKLGRTLTRDERKETVIEATIEMRKASGFGQLIIIAVFVPIFALSGIEGKMFKPMAAAFCFALLGALIFSFTVAPALASLFLSRSSSHRDPFLMRIFKRIYAPVLGLALRQKLLTVILALIATGTGIFLFSRLGSEFLPQLNEGSIVIMFNRDVNIGIDTAIEMQAKSETLIRTFPEVKQVFSRIGTAEVATDPMGIYLTDTFISLHNQKDWPLVDGKRETKDDLAERIAKTLNDKLPGQDPVITQPIEMRFNELLEGTRADISVKIFNDDLHNLLSASQEAEEILKTVPGAGDVEAEMSDTSPLLQILPKEDVLAHYGLSNSAILDTVETAIGGTEVGFFFEGVRRTPILIRLKESDRSNLETIRHLPVEIGPNLTVKLSELADIRESAGFGSIIRENGKRRAAILINPRDRDTQSFVTEAKDTLARKITLPAGSYFEWGGNFKNLEQAKARLMVLTPAVLILVLMMIFFVFRNLLQTILIFSGIPLALVGGVLALELNGLAFSISAGVGFIALSGIAILNGVVLVTYFNQLKAEGMAMQEIVTQGSLLRLRPVLMTALVDIFGFLPMMLSRGLGAEVQKPLATVVIGGIISSTLLTLIVLPAVYSWIFKQNQEDIEL